MAQSLLDRKEDRHILLKVKGMYFLIKHGGNKEHNQCPLCAWSHLKSPLNRFHHR